MPNNDRLLNPLEIQWNIYQNPGVKFNISTKHPKIHKEPQKLQIAKLILRGKNTARGTLKSDLITSQSCSHEDNFEWYKHTQLPVGHNSGPGNKWRNPRTPDLWKGWQNSWKKESLVYKWCGHSWISLCRGIKLDPLFLFTIYRKINLKPFKKFITWKANAPRGKLWQWSGRHQNRQEHSEPNSNSLETALRNQQMERHEIEMFLNRKRNFQ